jgi:hypothetical protein
VESGLFLSLAAVGAIKFCSSLFVGVVLAATAFAQAADGPFSPQALRRSPIEVLIFLRSDCPISNRFAPEVERLSQEFSAKGVQFWLVYPDRADSAANVATNAKEHGYSLPILRDADRALVKRSDATITPEAAVFSHGELIYHGRIDDRVAAFGKVRAAPTTHELQDALNAALLGKKPAVQEAPAVGCYISDLR